jgi:hypothetical protein
MVVKSSTEVHVARSRNIQFVSMAMSDNLATNTYLQGKAGVKANLSVGGEGIYREQIVYATAAGVPQFPSFKAVYID